MGAKTLFPFFELFFCDKLTFLNLLLLADLATLGLLFTVLLRSLETTGIWAREPEPASWLPWYWLFWVVSALRELFPDKNFSYNRLWSASR